MFSENRLTRWLVAMLHLLMLYPFPKHANGFVKGTTSFISAGDAFKSRAANQEVWWTVDLTLYGIHKVHLSNATHRLERGEQICKSLGPYERLHVANCKLCSLQLLVKKKKKNAVNSWQGGISFCNHLGVGARFLLTMSNFQGIYSRAFDILSSSLNNLVVCDFPHSGGSTIQILLGRNRTLCLKNAQTQSSVSEWRFGLSQPSASGVSSLIFSDYHTEAATCSFHLQP